MSLNAMNVEAVCEKLKQIEGLDQSLVPQYCTTIKKVLVPPWAAQGRGKGQRAAPLGPPRGSLLEWEGSNGN